MQPSNEIWYLMARSLSGEALAEEEALLQNKLQQSPHLQQQYNILKSSWAGGKHEEKHSADTEGKRISRILQLAKIHELLPAPAETHRIHRRLKRRRVVIKVIMYAGLAATLVFCAWLWEQNNTGKDIAQPRRLSEEVATQNGSRTRTMLPDGTTVWVNAGSKLTYDKDFAGATREVVLDGEAYFDVVKNPHRPFIVHTGGINIKVLGTVFNVKDYPADKTVETTLIRGLVQVTRSNDPQQKPVFLHPNEKLVVQKTIEENNGNREVQSSAVLPVIYKVAHLDSTVKEADRVETAWVYNRLEFRGENFENLAGKLERWYNVSIVFEDDKVKELTFNGSFENETVEQAFTALKTAVPFNFTIQGHEIKIKSLNKTK